MTDSDHYLSVPVPLSFGEDGDWEMVQKRDGVEEVEVVGEEKECSPEEGSPEEGSAEREVKSEDELITMVEADLISQIRLMYFEKQGKEATMVEEREWLKSIRHVEEEEGAGECEGEGEGR